jgi:hypothetical protein
MTMRDPAQTGQEHFHLHRRGILRFVQHHKRVPTADRACERRNFDLLSPQSAFPPAFRQKIIQHHKEAAYTDRSLVFFMSPEDS